MVNIPYELFNSVIDELCYSKDRDHYDSGDTYHT